jgi:hypothetical protein
MFPKILTQIFGSRNDRLLKTYRHSVERINALESGFEKMDDATLQAQTGAFRQRLADGATLDELLPEAFAVVREAGKRTLKMRHFDVQLVGGIALHQGKIAEMRTGEGKTLVATLPVYLNALAGRGVHVVTVNDYLAARDAEWMGRLYRFLGLTVGVNVPGLSREQKQAAFGADGPAAELLVVGPALGSVRHAITHHAIRATVRSARLAAGARVRAPLAWREPGELAGLGLTGMTRKILARPFARQPDRC